MIYFSSDWHLDHNRVITYCRRLDFLSSGERDRFLEAEAQYNEAVARGDKNAYDIMKSLPRWSQASVDRMNECIIDNCNAVARAGDTIVFLGDIIFGDYRRLRQLRQRIVCRDIAMIWGNHDKRLKEVWHTDKSVFYDIFSSCKDVDIIRYDHQKIWVSHYAHAVWDSSHHGVWHCYGHSHANFERWREEHMPKAKMVDVGVDYRAQLGYGYSLWSFDDLRERFKDFEGESVDHH